MICQIVEFQKSNACFMNLTNQKNTEKERADSVELCTDLIRSIERCQSELLEVMEQKQKAAETQAEELIKELEQEITELKRRNRELEQLSHTEDHLHLLQVSVSLCSRHRITLNMLRNLSLSLSPAVDLSVSVQTFRHQDLGWDPH